MKPDWVVAVDGCGNAPVLKPRTGAADVAAVAGLVKRLLVGEPKPIVVEDGLAVPGGLAAVAGLVVLNPNIPVVGAGAGAAVPGLMKLNDTALVAGFVGFAAAAVPKPIVGFGAVGLCPKLYPEKLGEALVAAGAADCPNANEGVGEVMEDGWAGLGAPKPNPAFNGAAVVAGAAVCPKLGTVCPNEGVDVCPNAGAAVCPKAGAAVCPNAGVVVCPKAGGLVCPKAGAAVCPNEGAAVCPNAGAAAACPNMPGVVACPNVLVAACCPNCPTVGAAEVVDAVELPNVGQAVVAGFAPKLTKPPPD